MNPRMWQHAATRAQRRAAREPTASHFVGPNDGEMAECGEDGPGRMAEPPEIVEAIARLLGRTCGDARGVAAHQAELDRSPAAACSSPPARRTSRSIRCATSPTAPPASRATPSPRAAAALGAEVTLVSGPGAGSPTRPACAWSRSRRRARCCDAVDALPADIAVFAAAVADWRAADEAAAEDQEEPRAARRHWSWSRTPTSSRPSRAGGQASAAGHRLCRRDRERRSRTPSEAPRQGRRLDRRQRRFARDRRHGRRSARQCISSRRAASRIGRRLSKDEMAAPAACPRGERCARRSAAA